LISGIIAVILIAAVVVFATRPRQAATTDQAFVDAISAWNAE
jgi:hypothetical protein